MNIKIMDGDLLTCSEQYIVHQANCSSRSASGLAYDLFKKFPHADIYSTRFNHSIPGDISIDGNGKNQRLVIAIFGQYFPGAPSLSLSSIDSEEKRLNYFQSGLNKIAAIPNITSVAFPFLIGCGLAKGKWENYLEMINNFADDNAHIDIKIFKK